MHAYLNEAFIGKSIFSTTKKVVLTTRNHTFSPNNKKHKFFILTFIAHSQSKNKIHMNTKLLKLGFLKPYKRLAFLMSVSLIMVAFSSNVRAQAPTISYFFPPKGPVGQTVTIFGTNFNTTASNNVVYFGATKAIVNSATATKLTVTVPTCATFSNISVLNTGNSLTAYSKDKFIPIYSPNKTAFVAANFAPIVNYNSGSYSTNNANCVVGDIDGDGKPDVVSTFGSNTAVSVFRNTSTTGTINSGSLAAKVDFATGTNTLGVTLKDLNGDGKLDIVITNTQGSSTIGVLKNTSTIGSINFASVVSYAVGTSPYASSIDDLDGDGRPDIAVANYNSNTISILLNNGTGGAISFATATSITTTGNPRDVQIVDLDGDDKLDLVTANNSNGKLSLLRNITTNGTLSFATAIDVTGGANNNYVIPADMDGDGKVDLVVPALNNNWVAVLKNNSTYGNISFATPMQLATAFPGTINLSVGDIDGDGKLDIAACHPSSLNNSLSIFHNTSTIGSLSFDPRILVNTGATYGDIIADIDGDNKPDIVNTTVTSLASITHNIATATANANLTGLSVSVGTLSPAFSSTTIIYTDTVATNTITLTPTLSDANAQVKINGITVTNNTASNPITINAGSNEINVIVTSTDGTTARTYTVYVYKNPCTTTSSTTDASICSNSSPYVWNGTSYSTSGSYSTTFVGGNAQGCDSVANLNLTITPSPTVTAPANQAVCAGQSVTLSGSGAITYSWNNGVSNDVAFMPSSTITYTVTGTSNGCSNTAQTTVTVNPLPTVNAGADKLICPGTSTSLTASGAVSYSWTGGITNGTSFSPSATTTYVVTGTDANNCSNKDTVVVNVRDLNVASITPVICKGVADTLTAPSGSNYQWKKNGAAMSGKTSRVISLTVIGSYTVTYTDSLCGVKTSPAVVLTLTTPPAKPILAATKASICPGDTTTLYATTSSFKFIWLLGSTTTILSGATSQNYHTATIGTYYVKAVDSFGCRSAVSGAKVIKASVVPVPAMTVANGTLGSKKLTCTNNSGTYQWRLNGSSITGATAKTYTATQTGAYSVRFTNGAGCTATTADTTLTINYTGPKMNQEALASMNNQEDIKVYPNPSSDIFFIEASEATKAIVTDLQGRKVLETNDTHQINLKENPSGIYFLQLMNEEGMLLKTEKIIKQ